MVCVRLFSATLSLALYYVSIVKLSLERSQYQQKCHGWTAFVLVSTYLSLRCSKKREQDL